MPHPLRWTAALLVVLATACNATTSAPPTPPPATAAPAATSAPTAAAAAKPTAAAASSSGAATATPNIPPQATAAPAVATTAANPAATAAAAVPATREAAAPTTTTTAAPAAQPTQPQPTPPAATGTAPPAAATTPAPSKPAATITVKGAYAQASSVQGALYIAREKGMFARHGLDVELSQIGGTQQVAALLSGELQFGALGANEVANADLRGADLVMIATCSDLPIFSLYANKKYTSVPELAGQSIGVTTAGSATDAAAHLFLRQFDMLDKVKILPAGGTVPAILAAMDQGNIAGGILSPPTTARAEDAGYAELVNGARLGVPMNHSGIAVSRSYLKDHMDEVKNFLAAYQEAWTYAADAANKADVIAVLAQYTQSDNRLAEIGYQAMVPIWTGNKTPRVNPQAVSNLLQVSGVPEAATANPDQFFDDSLIDSIAPPG
jgi:ABC-type nitrate/sulfonate/bicarbonate transport system substrate-binding protein